MGAARAAAVNLEEERESQFQSLRQDLAQRAKFAKLAPETYRCEALILDTDRDPADVALRRTAALLADLKRGARRQLKNPRNATRTKAEKFLKTDTGAPPVLRHGSDSGRSKESRQRSVNSQRSSVNGLSDETFV